MLHYKNDNVDEIVNAAHTYRHDRGAAGLASLLNMLNNESRKSVELELFIKSRKTPSLSG